MNDRRFTASALEKLRVPASRCCCRFPTRKHCVQDALLPAGDGPIKAIESSEPKTGEPNLMANETEFAVSAYSAITDRGQSAYIVGAVTCIAAPYSGHAVQWRIPNFTQVQHQRMNSEEFFCGGTPW